MNDRVDAIVRRLAESRKYSGLARSTLERIAIDAVRRHTKDADAEKAAKRRLHQVFGAYRAHDAAALARRVRELPSVDDRERFEAACRELLRMHASTAERIADVDAFYRDVFAFTGSPHVVLDLACGHQPFQWPWMGLAPDAMYLPRDLDGALIDAIDTFLEHVGRPRTARVQDVLVDAPDEPADVAFLLKVLPCLERQERGGALRVLRAVRARFVVVSFPIESLGGRDKGMRAQYSETMARWAAELAVEPVRIDCPTELVYVWRSRSESLRE
ncbi:MAG: hypothetical protein IPH13_08990 [Planctomycetes bacterium]|nr:hypothetical protein [Planctomycetota bacterium]MCC7172260.1 hypothetical protein [Planctomycetota bacterium]